MAVGSCSGGRTFILTANPDRNVLLVTIDTLRADALGSYGGRAATPNLDDLAAHGARFEFAHAHAVVTLVSHASILTGRYPYEHGTRVRYKGSNFALIITTRRASSWKSWNACTVIVS